MICLAILICLEHSFWLTQQGSSPTNAFTEAFDTYLKDKQMLLDQRLEEYLALKQSDDWFTIRHSPSDDECAEFQKIVLDNLLCKASSCLFYPCVADTISSAHPKLSIWYWDLKFGYICNAQSVTSKHFCSYISFKAWKVVLNLIPLGVILV